MPIHNAIKYGTQLLRGFSRLVGLGEDEEGTARLGESLTPILDVWSIPDASFLRGQTEWQARQSATAVALELAFVGIRNPAGSERIVVCTRIRVVAAGLSYTMHTGYQAVEAGVTGTGTLFGRDSRDVGGSGGGVAVPITTIGSNATTGAGGVVGPLASLVKPATEVADMGGVPLTLAPGSTIRVYSGTANEGLTVEYTGYTRQALPGELVV